MELTVVQGRNIRLPAEFFLGAIPADPAAPRVRVLDPSGRPVLVDAIPERDGPGLYHLNYQVAASAPTGVWTVRWTASLEGNDVSGEDAFTVFPAQVQTPVASRPAGRTTQTRVAHPAPAKLEESGRPADSKRVAHGRVAAGGPAKQVRSSEHGRTNPAPAPAAPPAASGAVQAPPARRSRRSTPAPAGEPGVALRRKATGPRPSPPKPGAPAGRPGATPAPEPDTPIRQRQPAGRRKRRLLAALLLSLLVVVTAATQIDNRNPTGTQRLFQQAEEALRAGEIDRARSYYLDIVLQDPDNKAALFDLGMLAHFQNRGAEAQDYYLRALNGDPNYLPALYNLAVLKDASGLVDEAILLYRQVIKNSPEHAASRFNLGLILHDKKGETEEGRREIEEAVRLDPTLAPRAAEAFAPASPPPPSP